MFIEKLSEKFNKDEPIFTEEIIELFQEYSRAQVFRYINKAKENKEIIQFSKGIYFIPSVTFWGGLSTITADSVIEKKYLRNAGETFGVFGGIKLLNNFSVTTQMAAVIEVVTNNETTRCREIDINGRRFILRKSRFEINKDNANAYMIMELFNNLNGEKIDEFAKRRLINFMREKGITKEQLMDVAMKFPAKALKNLIGSKILNELA